MTHSSSSDRFVSRHLVAAFIVTTIVLACARSTAQDVVYYNTPDGVQSVFGTIEDYNGVDGVTILANDTKRRIPVGDINRIETQRLPIHVSGDEAFENRDYATALERYRQARNEERRVWLRRELTARIVDCLDALGETERACEEFVLLVRSDGATPYMDCIPLAWRSAAPSATLEAKANEWITWKAIPAAQVLAASHLLSGAGRQGAVAELTLLADHADPRIVAMAKSQLWRVSLISVDAPTAERWEEGVETFPPESRAVAYFLVGEAMDRVGNEQQAVLAWMRSPTLYGRKPRLAAAALLKSADALHAMGRDEQARRLCRELIGRHAATDEAAKASRLLEIWSKDSGS